MLLFFINLALLDLLSGDWFWYLKIFLFLDGFKRVNFRGLFLINNKPLASGNRKMYIIKTECLSFHSY